MGPEVSALCDGLGGMSCNTDIVQAFVLNDKPAGNEAETQLLYTYPPGCEASYAADDVINSSLLSRV